LLVDDAQWVLPESSLVFNSEDADTASITSSDDGGTSFVPGWLSTTATSSSQSYSSSYSYSDSPPSQNARHSRAGGNPVPLPSTATGFNATDLDLYFTAGLMPDRPDTDPVWSGTASRDDAAFVTAITAPEQDKNGTITPSNDISTSVDLLGAAAAVFYDPPLAIVRFASPGMGRMQPEEAGVAADGPSFGLPTKPTGPELISQRDALQAQIDDLNRRLNNVTARLERELAKRLEDGISTHQAMKESDIADLDAAIRWVHQELKGAKQQHAVVVVILQDQHAATLEAEEAAKLEAEALKRLIEKRFTPEELETMISGLPVLRDGVQVLISDSDQWILFEWVEPEYRRFPIGAAANR
jgi:hypothetical protein